MLDMIESCGCLIVWSVFLLNILRLAWAINPMAGVLALVTFTNYSTMWIRYHWLQNALGLDKKEAWKEITARSNFTMCVLLSTGLGFFVLALGYVALAN